MFLAAWRAPFERARPARAARLFAARHPTLHPRSQNARRTGDLLIAFRDNGRNWFFSWLHSFPPVTHALPRSIELPGRDCSALVANGVGRDDPPILHEEPQYARVEFADVAQFEKSVTNGLGQRFPMILSVS